MAYIIIGGDGKEYGPVSGSDLRQWIAEERLDAQSLAKAESDAEFRPLATFPEFADAFGAKAPDTIAPPSLAPVGTGSRETALQRVKGPAVALKVTAILYIILVVGGWIIVTVFGPSLQHYFSEMAQANGLQMQKTFGSPNSPFAIASNLIGLVLSVLILIGATKMRSLQSYEFSMTAAIVAMLPCVTPCCLIGLPFGIWALVVLRKPDVKSHFN